MNINIVKLLFVLVPLMWCLDEEGNPEFELGANIPSIDSSIYPVCANVTWRADAYNPPSYLNNSGPTPVQLAFAMNNLMLVSEIESFAQMDFFFRTYWVDPRINIPELWDVLAEIKPTLLVDGIEIKEFLRDAAEPLRVWQPDIYLADSKETMIMVETVRLRPGGVIFWSRKAVATLQQSLFDYHKYPEDEQIIAVRAEDYGLNSNYVNVSFTNPNVRLEGYKMPPAVSFITIGGIRNIERSAIWKYVRNETFIYNPNYGSTSTKATKDTCVLYLYFQRISSGIVNRLAFPIMLLLLLVGLIFWSDYNNRVDSTITLLLAISALYIVIFSSVPMLGYSTTFDLYITGMFVMVVITVFMHQITARMLLKRESYPLRYFAVRILEIIGKLGVIPVVLISFLWTFPSYESPATRDALTGAAIAFSFYLAPREYSGMIHDLGEVMTRIRAKVDSPTTNTLTTVELLAFNWYTFRQVSSSAALYHRWKKEIDKEFLEPASSARKPGAIDESEHSEVELHNYRDTRATSTDQLFEVPGRKRSSLPQSSPVHGSNRRGTDVLRASDVRSTLHEL